MKNLVRLAALIAALAFGTAAHATSASTLTSSTAGVIDEATNLEWLNLRATAGWGYDQVTELLKPGGKYEGFHVANADQVVQLARHGGVAHSSQFHTEDPSEIADIKHFMSLIGMVPDVELFQFGSFGRVSGCVSDADGHSQCSGLSFSVGYQDSAAAALYPFSVNDNDYSYLSPIIGTFLYRSLPAIPEPETYIMLLTGLGLIGLTLRQKRNSNRDE